MEKENCQKIKLLKLMELLQQESNEERPLTSGELCGMLQEIGISCDRRTLHRDMRTLNAFGYEVLSVMVGHERAYYLEDRMFSLPELKILMDAVQAANFITEKKTEELTEKLSQLGGRNRAQRLRENMVHSHMHKHRNETVYYTVGYLEEALEKGRKVSFCYFDLDENGEKVLRKDGERYCVEPVSLIYSEDNYYLVAYYEKYGNTANYRIERMLNVQVEQELISAEARKRRAEIDGYAESAFRMFGGETEQVTLLFPRELIGAIYDRFGEDTVMRPVYGEYFSVTVRVIVSPPFWGWLFQYGGKLQIAAPEHLRKRCREQAEALLASMH